MWMRNKGKQASVTVFMSLLLMLIASLLFTLLEVSRYTALGMMAVLNSRCVTESVFAEYQLPAYQNYHLLLMDGGYGTESLDISEINARMQELGQENLNPAAAGIGDYTNFLQMDVTDSSVVRYELATDQNCGVLAEQMAAVMKQELAADLLKKAMDKVADIQGSESQGETADGYIDDALDTLEQAKEQAESAEGDADSGGVELRARGGIRLASREMPTEERPAGDAEEAPPQDVENPMEEVKKAQSSLILAQILSSETGISAKRTDAADAVERRVLNVGNYGEAHTVGAADKMLLVQYFAKYASCYLKKLDMPHALQYEQEYLLFGKYSDEDNLEKMAGRLLLLREGVDFAYLMTDSARRQEALAMATAIAAAAGIPMAANAIQMGLLASWAYAESVTEVRTLFSGGTIKTVKTGDSWGVGLSEIASVLMDTDRKSKTVSGGQSYEDYLQVFLYLENTEKLAKRFADLLEKNLRLYDGYGQVKLDCMVTAMETEMVYQAKQVFLSFVTIENLSKKGYGYRETCAFSYLHGQ